MTVAHARALLPRPPTLGTFNPRRDRQALEALANWALRFSPRVAPDPPDGLLLDITGCQRLFRGERRLLRLLLSRVRRLGLGARAAIAPTIGGAWALARFGPRDQHIISPGKLSAALASLPLAALRLDAATLAALEEVGLTHVRHLLVLPRASLPARFGTQLAQRLDQALGSATETIEPIRPIAPVTAARGFAGPTRQLEALEITVQELLAAVQQQLQTREAGARCLELCLVRSDCPPAYLKLNLTVPSRDAGHLWRLLRPRLETVHLGFGVERLVLTAARLSRLPHHQMGMNVGTGATSGGARPGMGATGRPSWGDRRSDDLKPAPTAPFDPRASHLLDELTNRLGTPRVLRFQPVATHIPECAFAPQSLPVKAGPVSPIIAPRPPRPSFLLPHPESIRVATTQPDGPVTSLRWRRQEYRILACIGPERLAPAWWRSSPADPGSGCRDYFRLLDASGCWLWVYRETDSGIWFLHGQWA
jgi:protein ImuB